MKSTIKCSLYGFLFVVIVSGQLMSQELKLLTPAAGYQATIGETIEVKWNSDYFNSDVIISLWNPQSGMWSVLGTAQAVRGEWIWEIPMDFQPGNYRIKVEEIAANNYAISDAFFSINATIMGSELIEPSVTSSLQDADREIIAILYPNPAMDRILVKNSHSRIQSVEVFDVGGNRILKSFSSEAETVSLELPQYWPSGIYFVKVNYENGRMETTDIRIIR